MAPSLRRIWEHDIELRHDRVGTQRLPCPECDRGSRDTALAVTVEQDGVVWICHRCGFKGAARDRTESITRPTSPLSRDGPLSRGVAVSAHGGALHPDEIDYSGFAADYAAQFDRQKLPTPDRVARRADELTEPMPIRCSRRPVEALLEKLETVRRVGEGRWRARCPSHQGKSASLAIREEPDGRLLIKCFAECATADVLAAIGLSLSDLFPARIGHSVEKVRRPFDSMHVLRSVAEEIQITACVCADIVSNRGISMMDFERVQLASERLWSALEVANESF